MHRAHDWRAGLVAALMFGGLGLPPLSDGAPWMAMYRVDTLGLALSIASIAVLNGGISWRRVLISGVIAGLAILTKQTYLAALSAGVIYLIFIDRRKAFSFGASALSLVTVVCAMFEITTRDLLTNTIFANRNPTHYNAFMFNMDILTRFQSGPLVIILTYFVVRLRSTRSLENDLLWIYWMLTIPSSLAMIKLGSSFNYWMELAASSSIISTTIIWKLSRGSIRDSLVSPSLLAALPILATIITAAPMIERHLHPAVRRI
jgi:hypothetical protein